MKTIRRCAIALTVLSACEPHVNGKFAEFDWGCYNETCEKPKIRKVTTENSSFSLEGDLFKIVVGTDQRTILTNSKSDVLDLPLNGVGKVSVRTDFEKEFFVYIRYLGIGNNEYKFDMWRAPLINTVTIPVSVNTKLEIGTYKKDPVSNSWFAIYGGSLEITNITFATKYQMPECYSIEPSLEGKISEAGKETIGPIIKNTTAFGYQIDYNPFVKVECNTPPFVYLNLFGNDMPKIVGELPSY